MELAIAERLVCPERHPRTPLVVRADVATGGRLEQGVLGCATCRKEWLVTNGVARFGERRAAEPGSETATHPDAMTIAALLGLTDPGALVIADGVTEPLIAALTAEFGTRVVAIDANTTSAAAAIIEGAARVPLSGVANGAVLFRATRDDAFVSSVVSALAARGRVVGRGEPLAVDGLRELARGDGLWVAERVPAATTVPLTVPLRRRAP